MAYCVTWTQKGRLKLTNADPCDTALLLTPIEYQTFKSLSVKTSSTIYQCDGTVTKETPTTFTCSENWNQSTSSSISFDPSSLDPAFIAGAVGAGFFVLLPVWAAATGIKHLLKAVPTKFY